MIDDSIHSITITCCAIKDDYIDNQAYIEPRRWRGSI